MYEDLAKALKNNIEIMTHTFENNNIQIINTGIKKCSDDDADFTFLFEVSTIKGSSIENDLSVNLNLYNNDGEIILHESFIIDCDHFQGYDTGSISCYLDSKALLLASKGRLYCTMY